MVQDGDERQQATQVDPLGRAVAHALLRTRLRLPGGVLRLHHAANRNPHYPPLSTISPHFSPPSSPWLPTGCQRTPPGEHRRRTHTRDQGDPGRGVRTVGLRPRSWRVDGRGVRTTGLRPRSWRVDGRGVRTTGLRPRSWRVDGRRPSTTGTNRSAARSTQVSSRSRACTALTISGAAASTVATDRPRTTSLNAGSTNRPAHSCGAHLRYTTHCMRAPVRPRR